MGLELRISIAKRLLLAAGLMLFAAPAYAACTTTGATSITTSGLYTVSGDGVFVTGGPIGGQ